MSSGTDRPSKRSWERWVRFVPAFLLLVVAGHQLYLSFTDGLSPWSGGGFGMFSTTDAGGNRHLHAFVLRPGIEREVSVPEALKPLERRSLTLPSNANLRALALELADLPAPDHGAATGVRIQVWRTRFDSDTLVPLGGIHRALKVSLEP
jgi:hypothetical protein